MVQRAPVVVDAAPLQIPDAESSWPTIPPELRGFSCTVYQWHKDKPDDLVEECFRSADTCNDLRKRLTKLKLAASACRPAPRAICFEIIKPRIMASFVRCFITDDACDANRDRYIDEVAEAILRTDCEPTR